MSRKKKISSVRLTLAIVTATLIIIIIGLLIFSSMIAERTVKKSSDTTTTTYQTTTTTEQTQYSRLDGRVISANRVDMQPLAIVIENHGQARPQSGLNSAEIVFETVAEGGITRFLAIFQRAAPSKVGPIRSAREYFVDVAKGYGAVFVHAGGSPTGFDMIKQLGVNAINGLEYEDQFVRSSDRAAPHNFYSSEKVLRSIAQELKFSKEKNVSGFSFKKESPTNQRPSSSKLSINFSQPNYVVSYEYNKLLNTYTRSNGGKEAVDTENGQPITPKNVILLITDITALDSYGRQRISLEGSGTAYLFSDGRLTTLNWFHGSPYEEIQFFQISGNKMELVPGQTWVEIISKEMDISYFENGEEVSLTGALQ